MFTNKPARIFFAPLGGPDEEALKAAYALITESEEAIRVQKASALFKCARCEETTPISQMEYIQSHWYTTPHGCTGGDYWTPGEGYALCPECGIEHRTHFSPGLADLKEYFGKQSDRRKD